jgi:plasmid stabilization system protein ParE
MAFKIIWSRQARDDLRDIMSFIAANNRPIAESFGFRLMAKVDVLEDFPELGRVVHLRPVQLAQARHDLMARTPRRANRFD